MHLAVLLRAYDVVNDLQRQVACSRGQAGVCVNVRAYVRAYVCMRVFIDSSDLVPMSFPS